MARSSSTPASRTRPQISQIEGAELIPPADVVDKIESVASDRSQRVIL